MIDLSAVKVNIRQSRQPIEVSEVSTKAIAVIGIGVKMPLADTVADFWKLLVNGVDCIRDLPAARRQDVLAMISGLYGEGESVQFEPGAYLEAIDRFDYGFFGLSPRESSLMDPNQRLFLETAWAAIEDAGYGGTKLIGSRTGVYLGFSSDSEYRRLIAATRPEDLAMAVPGNIKPIVASRLSYLLDLCGPSVTVDTTCSSSLFAIHLACKALRNSECELAVAGGLQVHLIPIRPVQIGVEASDGRAKSFDDKSDGTGTGEGVAAVLLKPLWKAERDRDPIYAVIKGSAANNDGSSIGITAPSATAQADVLSRAWQDAGVEPETITYIEAHGTGTKLGDPIEVDGITKAFRRYTSKKQFCGIGTIKTNIGHLDSSAGIAGFLKAVLALKYQKLPPSLHFNFPNRRIAFEESPVFVVDRLADWEPAGGPRRCGVSSFGLSGTNCHLVLEEAPPLTVASERKTTSWQVFCLSAKTQTALEELLRQYRQLVSEPIPKFDLADLCYTVNTGRGHYGYRLALVVRDLNDLRMKLRHPSLAASKFEGVFFGYHQLIRESSADREPDDLFPNEQQAFNQRVQTLIDALLNSAGDTATLLEEVCRLYVNGATVDWQQLYRNQSFRRLNLPSYPFDRQRCWLEPQPSVRPVQLSGALTGFPLLERLLAEAPGLEIYTTQLSVSKHWVLNEHVINDQNVLVGTAHLEMLLEACQKHFPAGVELTEVQFITPLVLKPNQQAIVELILQGEADRHFQFMVVSKQPKDDDSTESWQKHATGKVRPLTQTLAPQLNLQQLKDRYQEGYVIPDLGRYNESTMFDFGPRWNNIREMYVDQAELLSYVEIPAEFRDEVAHYPLHPALLDNALTTIPLLKNYLAARATPPDPDALFLPFAYRGVRVYRQLPGSFYSHVRLRPTLTDQPDLLSFAVTIADSAGKVLIEVEEYTLIRTGKIKLQEVTGREPSGLFHAIRWIPKPFTLSSTPHSPGLCLLLRDGSELGEALYTRLTAGGWQVVTVELGSDYYRLDENHYRMAGTPEDYKQLVADVTGRKIRRIIHLFAHDHSSTEIVSFDELKQSQHVGVNSLLHLAQALLTANISGAIDIRLIARSVYSVTGQESEIHPEYATLFGLARVINQEYPNLNCRTFDLDEMENLDALWVELQIASEDERVAFRNGQRFVEELTEQPVNDIPIAEMTFGAEGCYLITGGSGGLGLTIAQHLAANGQMNLAFINRTAFPKRDEWEHIIREGLNHKLIQAIRTVQAIEELGATVGIYQANVSIPSELTTVLEQVRNDYGPLRGIIHCAGVAGEGLIIHKELQRFETVLAPKVAGTWLLDQLTVNDPLDLMILFSSNNTLLGLPGQGDYTAANAYLDAFTSWRNRRGRKTLTINWPTWKENGMAVDYGVNSDGFMKAITNSQALAAFTTALNQGWERVIVGELNFQGNQLEEILKILPFQMAPELRTRLFSVINIRAQTIKTPNTVGTRAIVLKGRADQNYSETERKVAAIWGMILGYQELNINNSFFEIGGDSILLTKVQTQLERIFPGRVGLAELFAYPTIVKLARRIDDQCLPSSITVLDATAVDFIPTAPVRRYYPLSSAQQRIFILQQFDNAGTSYNMPGAFILEGVLQREKFQHAFNQLVERHESFRTSFGFEDGDPVQYIQPESKLEIGYHEGDPADIDRIIAGLIRPFDLSKPPLLRVELIKLSATKYIVVCDMHHLISDGTSLGIILREFMTVYQGKTPAPFRIHYKDFTEWQNRQLTQGKLKPQEDYWLGQFAGEIPVLQLQTDHPRSARQGFRGAHYKCRCDQVMTAGLKALAAKAETTLFTILLTAYFIVLAKASNQPDLVVGIGVNGRTHLDLEPIIGLFVNSLAIRSCPTDEKSVFGFVTEIKERLYLSYQNQDYPFDKLVEKLRIPRVAGRNPLYDVAFVMHNMETPRLEIEGLYCESYPVDLNSAKFDLTLYAVEEQGEVSLDFEYSTELFAAETIRRLAGWYLRIVEQLIADPACKLGDVTILDSTEQARIVAGIKQNQQRFDLEIDF